MKTFQLLLSFAFTCAAAQAQFDYTTNNGEITITGGCQSGSVIIPAMIDDLPVTSIGYYAFQDCIGVTSVAIPDSVISIEGSTFKGCTGLTNVTIPNSVTSIGDWAFRDCTSLTSVTIGNGVNSIGVLVFEGCISLITIEVDIQNSAYSSLDGVLFNKSEDLLIQYPAGKAGSYTIPESVANIFSFAFSGCTSLTRVVIPDSVWGIGGAAFSDCASLIGFYTLRGIRQDFFWPIVSGPRTAIIYYHAGSTGWGPTFSGRPTALWIEPPVYADWIGTTDLPLGSTGTDDPDQDLMNNRAEMLAGTNPTDRASALMLEREPRLEDLTDADKTPIHPNQHALYVRSIPGKTYAVQWANSPTGPWNVDAVFTATTTQMRFLFDKPGGQGFYRVILAQ